jgi:SAM-dependent methyltransferase
VFYGPDQAAIHHARFGDLARAAADLVIAELRAVDLRVGRVVDLGCGSGIYARAMSDAGYDVVGIDISPDMVELARRNAPGATFVVGSAHDFDLPAGVCAVTALGEVLNYATDSRAGLDALGRLAERARHALVPEGVFVFDVATPGRGGPGGRTERFHDGDGWVLGMRALEHDGKLERAISIFVRDGNAYRRVDEHHVLHLYEVHAVVDRLADLGFEVEVRDGYERPAIFPGWKVFMGRPTPGARGSW